MRKTVTIVFTDIAGFTNLAETSDPERLRRIMSRYFDEMRAVIERHGGTVAKFIGDAVMAVFGIPHVHEDDALRAVRAAAEMRDALVLLNEDLQRDWGIVIQVRTGVNTGEVVTEHGDVGHALVLGDAVNIAARLEQVASPREILLGEDTYRLVEGAVEAQLLEPLAVKGKSDRIGAFRLLRMLPGVHAAPARRLDAPLVGRGQELSLLRQAFERAVNERSCQLLTLVGAAGMGKSRLAAEFLTAVEDEAIVLQGHCLSYGEGITFWPVAEIVKGAAEVSEYDSADTARAKVAALLKDEQDAALIGERVGQAVGLVQTASASEDIFWGVRKLLEALARRQPLAVVFEDLHWAEPTFLDLVEHVVDWSRGAPILLLCLARPELLQQRPGWGQGRANASSIALTPLSEHESQRVMESLLGGEKLSGKVGSRISAAAEGNPLYLEATLSMLLDEGLLLRRAGCWVATTDLQDMKLPLTIQSLLTTRLDRLDSQERQVIEAAALIGTVFPREALAELVPEALGARIELSLARLTAKEFIRRQPSSGAEDVFRFHHSLIRDAAYNEMSKMSRAELHERYAAWLERTAGKRAGEYEEILGYHLEKAYRYGEEFHPPDAHSRQLARRAAEHLAAAGSRARMRSDMGAAVNLLSRAVALFPGHDQRRLDLLPDFAEALMSTGELERAEAALVEALEAATAAGNAQLRTHLLLARSMQRMFTDQQGGAEEAYRTAMSAIPLFETLSDELGLARSWRLLSIIHVALAHFSAAEEALDHAAAHAQRAGDRQEELDSLFWLPLPLWAGPATPDEGIRRCDDIIRRADGDRKVEASVLFVRGGFESMRGRFREARELFAMARAILEDLGLRVWIAGPWSQFYGAAEFLAGNPAAAERELRAGYDSLVQMGESGWCSTVAALLAKAVCAQGRYDEAEWFAQSSEEMAAGSDIYTQIVLRCVRAKVAAARGSLEEGERLCQEAVRLSEQTDFLQIRAEACMGLAEILHTAGRISQALAIFENARQLYEQKGDKVSAEHARQSIARLHEEVC